MTIIILLGRHWISTQTKTSYLLVVQETIYQQNSVHVHLKLSRFCSAAVFAVGWSGLTLTHIKLINPFSYTLIPTIYIRYKWHQKRINSGTLKACKWDETLPVITWNITRKRFFCSLWADSTFSCKRSICSSRGPSSRSLLRSSSSLSRCKWQQHTN